MNERERDEQAIREWIDSARRVGASKPGQGTVFTVWVSFDTLDRIERHLSPALSNAPGRRGDRLPPPLLDAPGQAGSPGEPGHD